MVGIDAQGMVGRPFDPACDAPPQELARSEADPLAAAGRAGCELEIHVRPMLSGAADAVSCSRCRRVRPMPTRAADAVSALLRA